MGSLSAKKRTSDRRCRQFVCAIVAARDAVLSSLERRSNSPERGAVDVNQAPTAASGTTTQTMTAARSFVWSEWRRSEAHSRRYLRSKRSSRGRDTPRISAARVFWPAAKRDAHDVIALDVVERWKRFGRRSALLRQPEVLRMNDAARREHRRPREAILQLTHVAAPSWREQRRERGVADDRLRVSRRLRGAAHETSRELAECRRAARGAAAATISTMRSR